jgi:hypothetical protein
MNNDQLFPNVPMQIKSMLRREALLAQGRSDAFQFAWDAKGDLSQLKAKVRETEDMINDPNLAKGSMAPGTTPHTYRQGYLAGLRDAIAIITRPMSEESD